jgi:hypothetical protein
LPPSEWTTVALRAAFSAAATTDLPNKRLRPRVRKETREVRVLQPPSREASGAGRRSSAMKTKTLTVPELLFVIGTRAALSAGVALLIAERLGTKTRKAVGRTLVAIGAVTTLPALMALRDKRSASAHAPT